MTQRATDGIVRSARRMLAIIVSMVRTRLGLFAIEIVQEQNRILQLLILMSLCVVFALMALMTLSLLIIVLFWDENRIAAIGGLLAFYVAAAVVTGFLLRRRSRGGSSLFATTLGELSRDQEALEDALDEEDIEPDFDRRRRHG